MKYAKKIDAGKCQCNFRGIKYGRKGSTTRSIREHLIKHHSDIPEVADDFSGKRVHLLDIPEVECDFSGKKNQTLSPVWKYSVRTSNDRAKCLLCGKLFWSTKGTQSGIRIHLLNFHSDNQDVVNDILATVQKKCIKRENQNKQSTVF